MITTIGKDEKLGHELECKKCDLGAEKDTLEKSSCEQTATLMGIKQFAINA